MTTAGGSTVFIQPSPSRATRDSPRRRLFVSSGRGLETTMIGIGRCTERGSMVMSSKSLYLPWYEAWSSEVTSR